MSKYKAVALCRVSTSKQRINGSSLEAQERSVQKCATLLDAEIVQTWSLDISSRKGKNVKRADLIEILEYCKRNKIDLLILDEVDRFMRSMTEHYWWKMNLLMAGTRVVYAKMPEIAFDDTPMAAFKEMVAAFQAEASNHERVIKAKDKMQIKIDQGLYPSYQHTGYMTSDIPGLHVPLEPHFSLLQTALRDIASNRKGLREALSSLNDSGFRLKSGKRLDMTKFKRILQQPYYYGAIRMGDFATNERGLHQPMITKEEFEINVRIAKGQKARFTMNRHNPEFPMNGLLCESCLKQQRSQVKFTGYEHNNGKAGASRKHYKRYRCRGCGLSFKRDELHELISAHLASYRLNEGLRERLMISLRKAWRETEKRSLEDISRLKAQIELESEQKQKLVISLAESPDLKEDIHELINQKREKIHRLTESLNNAQELESDFEAFAEFALTFVENLKEKWWSLGHEDRLRCEQLLFPEFLRIDENKKVSTPKVSPIYRYAKTNKTSDLHQMSYSGGSGGT